jgi:GT2 family glycosyltransferase
MVETSVIIPCWIIDNTLLQITHRCVQAIRDTSKVELILVDNGSLIWSDYLNSEADIIVKFPKNLGYTKAVNAGFKLASNNYMVVGNNDCFVSPGWEKEMKNTLNEVSSCGISCLHIKGTPKPKTRWIEQTTPGSWWMTRKNTFWVFGMLDEQFFNTFSDLDLVLRLKNKNLSVVASPNITIEHNKQSSLSKFVGHGEERARSMELFYGKWEGRPCFKEFVEAFENEGDGFYKSV